MLRSFRVGGRYHGVAAGLPSVRQLAHSGRGDRRRHRLVTFTSRPTAWTTACASRSRPISLAPATSCWQRTRTYSGKSPTIWRSPFEPHNSAIFFARPDGSLAILEGRPQRQRSSFATSMRLPHLANTPTRARCGSASAACRSPRAIVPTHRLRPASKRQVLRIGPTGSSTHAVSRARPPSHLCHGQPPRRPLQLLLLRACHRGHGRRRPSRS